MTLRELIQLLRRATDVSEIDKYRDEIVALIPETKIMLNFNQQNYAHQYDLWEHSLQTVVGLPKDIEDDIVYLAALVHDIGKAESEVEKVYDSLDEELTALQRQVDELSRANDIKEYENQALRAKLAQIDEKPVLLQGEEEELYAGEIKDMVLELIDEAIPRLVKNSRRDYVLRDILESNQYERLSEEKKREVKRILKGYTGMSGSVRSNLQDLGFTIAEDGKHYKLYLGNDSRNMVTLSKTPSDHREGDNASATICRNML